MLLLGANVWTCVVAALIHYGRRALSGRGYRLLVTALSLVLLGFAVRLLWSGARTLLRMA